MKKCSRCKKEKNLIEFNFKNKEKALRQYHCKECSRLYIRSHYNKRRKYYLEKALKRNKKVRNEIRNYLRQYLNIHSCADCGEADPIVLEFDHLSDKMATISEMHRNYTLEQVKQEVKKCQIRCANCHRRKTAKEQGWDKQFAPVA